MCEHFMIYFNFTLFLELLSKFQAIGSCSISRKNVKIFKV